MAISVEHLERVIESHIFDWEEEMRGTAECTCGFLCGETIDTTSYQTCIEAYAHHLAETIYEADDGHR